MTARHAGRKPGRRWARIALALASSLLFLLLLEGGTRLWLVSRGEDFAATFWVPDPELGARPRPNYRGPDEQGFGVRLSSLGLRNPEVEVPAPPGRTRVIAMGDSVTYGFAVAEDETYPRVLEAELAARGLTDVEVVNAGISGTTTYQGAVFLERDLLRLEPDVVLFAYMNNDRWESRGQVHTQEAIRAAYDGQRWPYVLHRFALGRVVNRFRAGGLDGVLQTPAARRVLAERIASRQAREVVLPPPRPLVPAGPGDRRLERIAAFGRMVPTVGLEQRRRLCDRVADLAQEHGFRLVFLNFYDHPYMVAPLRRARERLELGDAEGAREALLDYFSTAPVPETSGGRLMDFDLRANHDLATAYDLLGTPEAERSFYFPRSNFVRKPLYLDVEVNGVASEVAQRRGVEVIDFDDLGFEAYIDHIHLTPAGHRIVAARIADVLAE